MSARFDDVVRIMARLQCPGGCPGIESKTHESLALPHRGNPRSARYHRSTRLRQAQGRAGRRVCSRCCFTARSAPKRAPSPSTTCSSNSATSSYAAIRTSSAKVPTGHLPSIPTGRASLEDIQTSRANRKTDSVLHDILKPCRHCCGPTRPRFVPHGSDSTGREPTGAGCGPR